MTDFTQKNIPDGFYKDKQGACMKKECSCGKTNEEVDDCETCNIKISNITGWVCPLCKRGNSPYSAICPCTTYSIINTTGGN